MSEMPTHPANAEKVILVTAGASGIGRVVAEAFLARGHGVHVCDVDPAAVDGFLVANPRATASVADVAESAQVDAVFAELDSRYGRLDVLVNNAGVGQQPEPMEDLTEECFDRIVDVNIKAIFRTSKAIVPLMKAAGSGAILNMASTAGVSPRPNLTWYNASKGWVITATRSMAVELAAAGIRVNALNPVAGETPMLKTFMGEDTPEIRAKFLASIPIGRFSTPDDMGAAAAFLCSDDASMITGVTLEVDGGRCI